MFKPKDEIILHTYAEIPFMIVLKDQKGNISKQVWVRYNSPLGKFVISTTITTVRMASIGDWQDYLCAVCLTAYNKAKSKRESDLSTGKAKR